MDGPPRDLPLTLTWGDGDDSASWLPADRQDDGVLVSKLASEGVYRQDVPAVAHHILELADMEGIKVTCPECGCIIPYKLEARPTGAGDEEWFTQPCPLCCYSKLVTTIPARAVELRRRIETLRKKGTTTAADQARFKSLNKQYQRIMKRSS